ncbi:MAG: hypothetical protein ABI559_13140 [Chloroflexota bacterium]
MNALKHGSYSKQFAQVGAILASNDTVREALLALANKHNLRQTKADEVAALLLTRLFQRAEDVGRGRLKLSVPVDESDSINKAAARADRRHTRSTALRTPRSRKTHADNQTPDTAGVSQSNP